MTPAVPAVQYLRLCTCLPSPLLAFVVVLLHANICVRANALVGVHAQVRARVDAGNRHHVPSGNACYVYARHPKVLEQK